VRTVDRGSALPVSALLPAQAARIVSEVGGCAVRSSRSIDRGVMTFKCVVETERNERFIVRFYPPRRATVVDQEPDLLLRCQRAGFPVPRVIADSRTGPQADLAYVVYPMIEGETLADRLPQLSTTQTQLLARELATLLHRMQSVDFEGSGELCNGLAARDRSWPAFVRESFAIGVDVVRRTALVDAQVVELLTAAAERAQSCQFPEASRLVWGDINFDNVLVNANANGQVTGLLDFESCLSGEPLATLGYCLAAHGDQAFCRALLQAWPERLDESQQERVILYAILRVLRLARYAHLPLPTGYARDPIVVIFPGLLPALSMLINRP
jgi:aminoglycoside phosphotransferase (APT) family kinase protein